MINEEYMTTKERIVLIMAIIIVLLIPVVVYWYEGKGEKEGVIDDITKENEEEEEMVEEIDTSDWLTYRNEEYGFELRYPEGWNPYYNFKATHKFPVSIKKISEAVESRESLDLPPPWAITKDEMLEEKKEIEELKIGIELSEIEGTFRKIVLLKDEVKAKTYLGGAEGTPIYKQYTIYKDDFQINIGIAYDDIPYSEALEVRKEINDGVADKNIQQVFDEFDNIIQTFRFLEINE